MQASGVVSQRHILSRSTRVREIQLTAHTREQESDLTGRIRRDRRVRVLDVREERPDVPDHPGDQVEVQPLAFPLCAEHSVVRIQRAFHRLEELWLEEHIRRADGV